MRTPTLALLVLAATLAGCSGGGKGDPADQADFDDLDLAATATTGVIRGIVVDEAVRPVANALLTLQLESGARTTESTAEGTFGFDDLAPGTYFVQAGKPGYVPTQASADVVAGVAEPPIVKVLLSADPGSLPFFEAVTWDGFIECSARTPAVGVALCEGYGNDDVVHDVELASGVPTFAQGELVWESTQQLGDELSFNWRQDDTNSDYIDTEGPSPLLLAANHTLLAANDVGAGQPLRTVIFSAHNSATEPPCAPDPVGCTWGVGVQLQQRFTMYLHVFYNFAPPEGWRFTADGDPVVPS